LAGGGAKLTDDEGGKSGGIGGAKSDG